MQSEEIDQVPTGFCKRASSRSRDSQGQLRRPTRRPSNDDAFPGSVAFESKINIPLKAMEEELRKIQPLKGLKRLSSSQTEQTTKSSHCGCDERPALPPRKGSLELSASNAPTKTPSDSVVEDLPSWPCEIYLEDLNDLNSQDEDDLPSLAPPSLKGNTSSSSLLLTEDRIRSFMTDYYADFDSIFQANAGNEIQKRKECLSSFAEQYFTDDYCCVRPSGNPLDKDGFVTLCAEDIEMISVELVSIDSVQMLARNTVAVVVYTADQIFNYKGVPNSDRATITAVLHAASETQEGLFRIGHEQRSVGKPIPRLTRWDSLA